MQWEVTSVQGIAAIFITIALIVHVVGRNKCARYRHHPHHYRIDSASMNTSKQST